VTGLDRERIGGGKGNRGRGGKTNDADDDVQVVTQYPRAENACGKEVTAQMRVATKNVGDCFVAIFFCSQHTWTQFQKGRENA
jgi:hypothetical protein